MQKFYLFCFGSLVLFFFFHSSLPTHVLGQSLHFDTKKEKYVTQDWERLPIAKPLSPSCELVHDQREEFRGRELYTSSPVLIHLSLSIDRYGKQVIYKNTCTSMILVHSHSHTQSNQGNSIL